MIRRCSLFTAALAAVTFAATPALALRIAAPNAPLARALTADAVIVGKVTVIEKDTVEAPPHKDATEKVVYKVAVLKIDSALVAAKGLTHIRVGFQQPQETPNTGGRVPRRPNLNVVLKENQEGCFFLFKHPSAEFYTVQFMAPPLDAKATTFKKQLEQIRHGLAAVEDPMKSLKAEKPADRFLAAAALVAKYRAFPADGREVDQAAIPAEETKLIFQALLERDWTKTEEGLPMPVTVMYSLGLNPQDGGFQPAPFQGQGDYNQHFKSEFAKWVEGPGAKYSIKKLVPKQK